MRKSDKNTIQSLVSLIIFIFGFIYRNAFLNIIPGSIYIFLLLIISLLIGLAVAAMIPGKKKRKQKNPTLQKNTVKNNPNGTPKNKDLNYYLRYDIPSMSGDDFEKLCYMYFKDLGYRPKTTEKTGDHGVDLVIKDPNDGLDIAVQCKCYKGKSIGNADIIKLQGGKSYYKCPGTFFITTSTYTKKAIEFGESINMKMWNGLMVEEKIGKWRKKQLKKLSL